VPTYQYRCRECGKSFERTETISEHEKAKVRCPKCDGKNLTQVPGRVRRDIQEELVRRSHYGQS
jgi:putative FmdB family regulatory protein